jgi:hypothetical protein
VRPDRTRTTEFEKKATRIAVGLVIAGPVLAFVTIILGAADVFPYKYAEAAALTAMLVPIGLALLIGAMGGLYLMGGWKVTPFGLLFVAGFGALVYGIARADSPWLLAGAGMLGISTAAFFVAGTGSGRAPTSARGTWGAVAALVIGAAATAAGILIESWWVLLFGTMIVGSGAGILIGRRRTGRRRDPDGEGLPSS